MNFKKESSYVDLRFETENASGFVNELRTKVRLFEQLTGNKPRITVYGLFKDCSRSKDELIFGDSGIDVQDVGHKVMTGDVDGRSTRFVPVPDEDRSNRQKFSFILGVQR